MREAKDVSVFESHPREVFARQVFEGLPLADAVLSLQSYLLHPAFLNDLFERHRGCCYQDILSFPTFVCLTADALQKHSGSARQSLLRAKQEKRLPTTPEAFYGKLRRMPVLLSQALVVEAGMRLHPLLPATAARSLSESLQGLNVYIVDGKKLKKVAKRLLPARGYPGKLFGGKLLVAWRPTSGLAFAMSAHLDGEKNDSPLMPALLPQVAEALPGPRLAVADRQFCDLVQIERWRKNGDHFVLRYHPKVGFHPDPQRATQTKQDSQGRTIIEQWGWLGADNQRHRPYVRRITLQRKDDEEDVLLVTDLLDAQAHPAEDLLQVYLLRWRIECVFQQITEVFSLEHLIASTPQGTIFQAAFCLVWYNLIQVVRSYIATGQPEPLPVESVSSEMLFIDIREELIALGKLVTPPEVVSLIPSAWTREQITARLRQRLSNRWRPIWRKAVNKKPRPRVEPAKKSGAHTSVQRILETYQRDQGPH